MKSDKRKYLVGLGIVLFFPAVYYVVLIISIKKSDFGIDEFLLNSAMTTEEVLTIPKAGVVTVSYFDDGSYFVFRSVDSKKIHLSSFAELSEFFKICDSRSRLILVYGGTVNGAGKSINSDFHRNQNLENRISQAFKLFSILKER
tara:strand:- start:216 stop:650 length:435 start_codon:yes stop_codon:yes gene_type:complete